MDDAIRKTLAAIDAAVRWKPPEGPVTLSADYLRLVERAEALPQNRPGTDKTWVERMVAISRFELASARELRRAPD